MQWKLILSNVVWFLLQMFNCITELVLKAKKEVLAKQQQQQQNDVVKLTRNSKRKKKCC